MGIKVGGNKNGSLQTRWCYRSLLEGLVLSEDGQDGPASFPSPLTPPLVLSNVLSVLPEPEVSLPSISEIFGVTHSNFS